MFRLLVVKRLESTFWPLLPKRTGGGGVCAIDISSAVRVLHSDSIICHKLPKRRLASNYLHFFKVIYTVPEPLHFWNSRVNSVKNYWDENRVVRKGKLSTHVSSLKVALLYASDFQFATFDTILCDTCCLPASSMKWSVKGKHFDLTVSFSNKTIFFVNDLLRL